MKLIGYWMQSLRDTDYFLPQEFVGELSHEVRKAIADHLDAGADFEVYRGFSWCRFCRDFKNGCRELSDGCWVWPEGLSHYVRQHRVVLPREFIDHVLAGRSPIPEVNWDRSVDAEFWIEWCRLNASGQYRSQLTSALEQAHWEAESLLVDAAAEMETREGISQTDCRCFGCTRKALSGRALCARCIIDAQSDNYSGHVYFNFDAVLHPSDRS